MERRGAFDRVGYRVYRACIGEPAGHEVIKGALYLHYRVEGLLI